MIDLSRISPCCESRPGKTQPACHEECATQISPGNLSDLGSSRTQRFCALGTSNVTQREHPNVVTDVVTLETERVTPSGVRSISAANAADQINARIARVAEWPNLLSDIKRLEVIEHSGKRWHVKIETRTMDCGAHDHYIGHSARSN